MVMDPKALMNIPISLWRRMTEAWENGGDTRLRHAASRQHAVPFEPYFKAGDTVRIFKSDGVSDVKIDAVGALPERRWDNGQLTAASNLAADNTQLDMPTGNLAQYRFSPAQPFEVELTHPSSVIRQWRSDTTNYRIPMYQYDESLPDFLREYLFAASEFWVYEDITPRFDIYRLSTVQVEMHIDFWGWRYHFIKLQAGERGKLELRTDGWPG